MLFVDQRSEMLCELGSTMNFMTKEEQWIIQLCSFVYLCHHFGVTLMFLAQHYRCFMMEMFLASPPAAKEVEVEVGEGGGERRGRRVSK